MTVPPFVIRDIRGRILLIEDASVLREIQILLLRSAGYNVIACAAPDEAIAEFDLQPFDAVVLNSDRNAIQLQALVDSLRRHRPNVPILAFVSSLDAEATAGLTQRGVSAIFERPKTATLMLQQIDGLLNSAPIPAAPRLASETPQPDTGRGQMWSAIESLTGR